MRPKHLLTRRQFGWLTGLLATTTLAGEAWSIPSPVDRLHAGFARPPNSARPRVWWHWMNGNITRNGIGRDIDWMSRTGLGGLQNFDAALDTPQVVDERLVYMSAAWKDAFRYAVGRAEQAGMEFAIAAAPGWSETGGPWVEPKDAMKKLVWSELTIDGGQPFSGRLPTPPATSGHFQSIPRVAEKSSADSAVELYGDVAVLAYRLLEEPLKPPSRAFVNGAAVEPTLLSAENYQGGIEAPQGTTVAPTVIELAFERRQTVRSAEVFIPGDIRGLVVPNIAWLEALTPAGSWRKVADIALAAVPTTVGFPRIEARAFRLVMAPNPNPSPFAPPVPPPRFWVRRFRLSSEPRVNRFETKAGFQVSVEYDGLDKGLEADEKGVPSAEIVDLTDRLAEDGALDWTPPAGRWRIVRLGYSLTGATNHPATAEATGLEVDKFDRDAVRRYIETYLGFYEDAAGAGLFGKRGVRALLNDSTEVGPANWTPTFVTEFCKRRGYGPLPWLLAATGVLVGSRRASDGFLFDFRQTLAELHAEHHYAQIAETAHQRGLTVYGEAHEGLYGIVGDDLAMRRYTDIPMGALWTFPSGGGALLTHQMDCKGAASVANFYGKRAVAAESLTSFGPPFSDCPSSLKPVIDLAFALGVNLPVIHTSAHQPLDDRKPGLSLGGVGQFFSRHETWAGMARPWVDYMARSAFLLQQGRNVADIAYFYGEGAPIIARFGEAPPAGAPTLYAFDFINAEALNALAVEGDTLVAPGGARYRALFLGSGSRTMTLPTLRRIAALAAAGATIIGQRPVASPSLADDPEAFEALSWRLWVGGARGTVGRGQVLVASDADQALSALDIAPDFAIRDRNDLKVLFVHRKLEDGDLYFLSNRSRSEESFEAAFRVTGKRPQIWRADTGAIEPASYRTQGEVTIVSLLMAPEDAVFIIFRDEAAHPSAMASPPRWKHAATVDGPWRVTFQPGRGAPPRTELSSLRSLSENPDPGIRYFSGEATYSATFTPPAGFTAGSPLLLDLGMVADLAEVRVNGRPAGHAWKAPYRVEIGAVLKPGRNTLEIKVANVWVNRLIGDAQPGVRKVTYTTFPAYAADAPLRPAGLLGPVRLLTPARGQS